MITDTRKDTRPVLKHIGANMNVFTSVPSSRRKSENARVRRFVQLQRCWRLLIRLRA